MSKKVEDFIKFKMLSINARFAYQEFIKAIKSNDVREIETSTVVKLFDNIINNCYSFESVLPENTYLYRARIVKDMEDLPIADEEDVFSGYDEFGSKEPPLSLSEEGRCNAKGVSYLYLAEEDYTACAEVKPMYLSLISVATYKIKQKLKILDLDIARSKPVLPKIDEFEDYDVKSIISFVMKQFSLSSGPFGQYEISQYIADYFRKAKYDGLAYNSSQTNKRCYVIFSSHKNFVEFVSSEIYLVDRSEFSYVNLKEGKHSEVFADRKLTSEEIRKNCEKFKKERKTIKAIKQSKK